MVVGRGNIRPPAAKDCTDNPYASDESRQTRVRPRRKDVPEKDKGKSRTYEQHISHGQMPEPWSLPTRCDRDEELEDRALGIAVTNCRRYRGKPLLRIALNVEVSMGSFISVKGTPT